MKDHQIKDILERLLKSLNEAQVVMNQALGMQTDYEKEWTTFGKFSMKNKRRLLP